MAAPVVSGIIRFRIREETAELRRKMRNNLHHAKASLKTAYQKYKDYDARTTCASYNDSNALNTVHFTWYCGEHRLQSPEAEIQEGSGCTKPGTQMTSQSRPHTIFTTAEQKSFSGHAMFFSTTQLLFFVPPSTLSLHIAVAGLCGAREHRACGRA